MYYAVLREGGPAWDSTRPMREQSGWTEHAAYMEQLVEDGVIVLGGPIGTNKHRVLLIFDAEDEALVRTRLAADNWTSMGLLQTTSIEPWQVLLGKP